MVVLIQPVLNLVQYGLALCCGGSARVQWCVCAGTAVKGACNGKVGSQRWQDQLNPTCCRKVCRSEGGSTKAKVRAGRPRYTMYNASGAAKGKGRQAAGRWGVGAPGGKTVHG